MTCQPRITGSPGARSTPATSRVARRLPFALGPAAVPVYVEAEQLEVEQVAHAAPEPAHAPGLQPPGDADVVGLQWSLPPSRSSSRSSCNPRGPTSARSERAVSEGLAEAGRLLWAEVLAALERLVPPPCGHVGSGGLLRANGRARRRIVTFAGKVTSRSVTIAARPAAAKSGHRAQRREDRPHARRAARPRSHRSWSRPTSPVRVEVDPVAPDAPDEAEGLAHAVTDGVHRALAGGPLPRVGAQITGLGWRPTTAIR